MDLIKISDTKLKIMLTPSDMTRYDLHSDSISIADQHVRRVLRRLLADAKAQTGFDGDMTRLYVQMYTCADGGCELFISKPEQNEESSSFCGLPVLSASTQYGRAIGAPERHGLDMCAYSFVKLEHLISVCKRLASIGYCGQSNAYIDLKKTYYLVLNDLPSPSLYSPDEYCFLGEYGNRENARSLNAYLCEYCTMLCKDNAVQMLMQL